MVRCCSATVSYTHLDVYKRQLYAYLKEEQRSPWWSAIFSAPCKVLGWTLSLVKDEREEGDAKLDPFRLTRDESAIADALSKRISVSVDKKTALYCPRAVRGKDL